MALTDEQKTEISSIVSASIKSVNEKAASDKAAQDAADKSKTDGNSDNSKTKSINDEAKGILDAEKAAQNSLNQIQESVKFNISISDFAEKNKHLLPEEASKILTTIASKTFKDDNEKANTVRKSFLDSFLEKQENLDVLTSSMKTRAETYKTLAESDKERKSSEFWDLVEVGLALKQGARKAEALNKINGGNAGDSSNPLEDKILAAAEKKFNNQNN